MKTLSPQARRRQSETLRTIGWLASIGFSIHPAETSRCAAGELPIVTVYNVTDPYGASKRLSPSEIVRWHKLA